MAAHSLHIGTNYTDTFNELSGCQNDARDLHRLCGGKVSTSHKLIGKQCTRAGIVRAFRRARHTLKEPGDLLFVSFSGHGTRERVGKGYVEAMVCDDLELIYDYEWADECADRAPGTFIIGLLDCCHSETLHRGFPRVKKRSMPVRRCKSHKHGDTKPRALTNCGFIAGCEEESYSYDGVFNGRPNGALTYYAIQAIKQLEKGATFNDLFQLVGGKRPKGYLPSDDYPQQPTRMGSAKNFAREIPFL